VSGDYAYVADGTSGLAIIQVRKRVDMRDPLITNALGDLSVEFGYTGQSISWTAVDSNPNTYTIDLQGSGIVAGPAEWGFGLAIMYNIPEAFDIGIYVYTVNFTDDYGNSISDSVTFTVNEDTTNPSITNSPTDLVVEFGYTGQIISWTAVDPNPNEYTVELQGSGIVAGPNTWTSGVAVMYNIPEGFNIGIYIYTVNFTDDAGNSISESVTFKVEDSTNPIITNTPSDFTVEFGYTGQSISWTATDLHPNTYSIELQGMGIVTGPTIWTSGEVITYNIPDGFELGVYDYTVNFTDDYGNLILESVTFTVGDITNPVIASSQNDITVEFGYTGQSISWTATDPNPSEYTVELQESGFVVVPTVWTSGLVITYDIPDGFTVGVYVYIVNFTDDYGNFITESVTFTVSEDTTNPSVTNSPSNLVVEFGYMEESFSWTAADSNPNTYTILLQGSGIVAGPTAWISGLEITYNIPEGFDVGIYIYTVNFTDDAGNYVSEMFTFTVEDTTHPIIIEASSDLTVEFEYTGQNISWTATDFNPNTYTIELNGSGIVVSPTTWTSGVAITYNIPNEFVVGTYIYTITFTDDGGNFVTDSITFTVEEARGGIPGGSFEKILILSMGTVVSIIILKKKKFRSNLE